MWSQLSGSLEEIRTEKGSATPRTETLLDEQNLRLRRAMPPREQDGRVQPSAGSTRRNEAESQKAAQLRIHVLKEGGVVVISRGNVIVSTSVPGNLS